MKGNSFICLIVPSRTDWSKLYRIQEHKDCDVLSRYFFPLSSKWYGPCPWVIIVVLWRGLPGAHVNMRWSDTASTTWCDAQDPIDRSWSGDIDIGTLLSITFCGLRKDMVRQRSCLQWIRYKKSKSNKITVTIMDNHMNSNKGKSLELIFFKLMMMWHHLLSEKDFRVASVYILTAKVVAAALTWYWVERIMIEIRWKIRDVEAQNQKDGVRYHVASSHKDILLENNCPPWEQTSPCYVTNTIAEHPTFTKRISFIHHSSLNMIQVR